MKKYENKPKLINYSICNTYLFDYNGDGVNFGEGFGIFFKRGTMKSGKWVQYGVHKSFSGKNDIPRMRFDVDGQWNSLNIVVILLGKQIEIEVRLGRIK